MDDDDDTNNNAVEEEAEADQDEDVSDADEQGGEDGAGGGSTEPTLPISAVSNLDSLYGLREIGKEALCWQLSSAKPGNGVEQIRDQSTDTYWQSDGVSQPHSIRVHFGRRVALSHLCLYLDYNLDESYTPKTLSIQVGMTTQDLTPAIFPANTVVELTEPVGWCIIPLMAPPDPLDDFDGDDNGNASGRVIRTHLIQISIISMHQNGRDTHIRQVHLYGPRTTNIFPSFPNEIPSDHNQETDEIKRRRQTDDEFSSVAMSQFSVLR